MELISGLVLYFACVAVTIAIARSGAGGMLGRLTANDTVAAVLASMLSCVFIIALLMVFFYAHQWTHSGYIDGVMLVALIVLTIVGFSVGSRNRKAPAA